MLTPVTKDYELYLGSTFFDRLIWWNKSGKAKITDSSGTLTEGSPIDLTYARIRMQWRLTKIPDPKNPDNLILDLDSSREIEVTHQNIETGIKIVDPKIGHFTITVSADDTAKIDYDLIRAVYYDLEIEIDGYVYTVMKGKVKFRPQITI